MTIIDATMARTIPLITEPFVRQGMFKTQSEALRAVVLQYVQRQIDELEREIANFRQKYGMDFEQWTETLKGKATIEEEDDWMEWESVRDALENWRKIKIELEHSNV